MRAYKGFDEHLRCRGYQYEVGKTYTHDGDIELCDSGFHFCKDLVLCFEFYPFDASNRFCEVEVVTDPIWDEVGHKGVATTIRVVREIPRNEILSLIDDPDKQNSGDGNSGYRNSGYGNSGYRNSGDWNSGNWNSGNGNSGNGNSGYRNSGYRNSGDWNQTDRESGAFNTSRPDTIRAFNQPCDIQVWDSAYKPGFLYFDIAKGQTYQEAFVASWESADTDDRERVRDLPNFDAEVFFEISGIDLR